jgi:hypothetical protein
MGSLRDDILAADDLPREVVPTPEWGPAVHEVWVRGLTAAERDAYEQGLLVTGRGTTRIREKIENLRAAFCVRIMVDENGERVFTDKDVAALGDKSGAVLDRIWDKGRELSGMKTEAEREDEDPSQPDASNSTDSP